MEEKIRIFEGLVESIILYGVELWGWRKYEEIEKIQKKYLKWCLGVNRNTADFLIML